MASEIFVDNQKQNPKKISFVLKSAFLIAVFILCANIIALKTGLTEQMSKIFYWPAEGSVAGEYTVRVAAAGGPEWNPPYPRAAQISPTADSYFTGCADLYSKFDFVGLSAANQRCAKAIKDSGSQTIVFGTFGSNIVLPDAESKEDNFKDTLKYLAFRNNSYRLTENVSPNATAIDIKVDNTQGLVPSGNGRAIIVTGPNKLADINQVLLYPELDRFTYASVDSVNNTLKSVGAGHVDFTYHAGDYLIQPAKNGGWIVNVSTRNPIYQETINYFLAYKYNNVPTAVLNQFDGIWYDLFRIQGIENPEFTNVDFNFDYIADTAAEKASSWQAGVRETFVKEKQKTGKNYIITNDGYGVIPPTSVATWHDGFILEEGMRSLNSWKEYYDTLNLWGGSGNKFIVCTDGNHDAGWWNADKKLTYKDKFNDMRYGLTTNTMGGGFYGKSVGPMYQMGHWYDEFDTNLGYPKGPPQKITNLCFTERLNYTDFERCPYIRFFDNGAAIVNSTFKPQTIKNSDISGLSGYAGPYYRFYGGQAPTFNNGHELTDSDTISLYGVYSGNPGNESLNKGDGILLFKNPNYYVVSDIMVGNFNNNDTSPASRPVETSGNWSNGIDTGSKTNPYYSQWNWNGDEAWGYFYTTDQAATATFRPTIGIGGEYEVFEWHGWAGSSAGGEATNVKTEIKHSSGTANKTINQQGNYGRWNSLGKFVFNAGTDGYVKISATGADGTVLADVIKFVFTANSVQPPQPPPPPTCNNDGTCDSPGETNANCPNDCPPAPSGQCYAADHFLNSTLADFSKFHFKGGPEKQVDFPDNTHVRIHLEGSMNNPTSGIIIKNDVPAGTTDFEVKVERAGPEDEVEILFMEGNPDACKNFLIALHPVSFANASGKTSPTGSAGLGCTDSNQCKRFLEVQYYGDGTKSTSADNLPGYPNCDDVNPKKFVLVSDQSKIDNLRVLKIVKQGAVYDIYNDTQKIGTYTDSKNFNISKIAVVNRSGNSLTSDYATIGPIGVDCFTNNTNLMADLNCDGRVDVIDLGILLSCWQDNFKIGCVSSSISCDKSPDINIDGAVNIVDFGLMLGCWGNNASESCKAPSSP